jgi:hypothetical protein
MFVANFQFKQNNFIGSEECSFCWLGDKWAQKQRKKRLKNELQMELQRSTKASVICRPVAAYNNYQEAILQHCRYNNKITANNQASVVDQIKTA